MRQYKIGSSDKRAFPLGLTHVEGGIHVAVAAAAETCSLLLYLSKKNQDQEEPIRIPFPEEGRMGNVWEMTVLGKDLDRYEYVFEADGKPFADPCGERFSGREEWGSIEAAKQVLRTPVKETDFDWEGDRPLRIPYEDSVVYRLHVRGFTKHASSGVKGKGTYQGIVEKIPYFQELGITTLELLPVAEFAEVIVPEHVQGSPYGETEPTGRLNYWGYAPSFARAPKASYAGRGKDPQLEFKKLVKALHQAGIEIVIELYFDGKEPADYVVETVRHWVREYHVDGVHLTGQAPAWLVAQDPYLADTKLWAVAWDESLAVPGSMRCLGEHNDGFMMDMRRVLKGDEGQMNALVFRSRRNPAGYGVLNYIAGTNGFTLADLVTYDQKHNEANGEDNQDGSEYNYSWNCGVEGPTRKKKIAALRRQQQRNALLMVFLSQGTPLLLAGDEFGNTQNGNNNAYCQDNEISWLNWRQIKANQDLLDFVKYVIAFRKAHPVFHGSREPKLMDYKSCGMPDVSYHGVNAWCPEFDSFRRQMGIMYSGAYGMRPDGTEDDYFYVAYNLHWEPHEFALPNLPKGLKWHVAFDTGSLENNGYFLPGQEPLSKGQKHIMVPSRTVLVLIGKETSEDEDIKPMKTPKNLDKA